MVKAGPGPGSKQSGKTPPPPPGGGQIGKSGVKIADFDPILTQIGSKSVKAAENFRPAAGHKTVKVGSAEIWGKSVKAPDPSETLHPPYTAFADFVLGDSRSLKHPKGRVGSIFR